MKKYLLLLSFALTTLQLQAEERRTVYCSTTTSGYVSIDYGQPHLNKNWLVDENGKFVRMALILKLLEWQKSGDKEFTQHGTAMNCKCHNPLCISNLEPARP